MYGTGTVAVYTSENGTSYIVFEFLSEFVSDFFCNHLCSFEDFAFHEVFKLEDCFEQIHVRLHLFENFFIREKFSHIKFFEGVFFEDFGSLFREKRSHLCNPFGGCKLGFVETAFSVLTSDIITLRPAVKVIEQLFHIPKTLYIPLTSCKFKLSVGKSAQNKSPAVYSIR